VRSECVLGSWGTIIVNRKLKNKTFVGEKEEGPFSRGKKTKGGGDLRERSLVALGGEVGASLKNRGEGNPNEHRTKREKKSSEKKDRKWGGEKRDHQKCSIRCCTGKRERNWT